MSLWVNFVGKFNTPFRLFTRCFSLLKKSVCTGIKLFHFFRRSLCLSLPLYPFLFSTQFPEVQYSSRWQKRNIFPYFAFKLSLQENTKSSSGCSNIEIDEKMRCKKGKKTQKRFDKEWGIETRKVGIISLSLSNSFHEPKK